ncbi:MAG: hypothetical protein P8Y10_10905 [Gemmatimonadales bacterium]
MGDLDAALALGHVGRAEALQGNRIHVGAWRDRVAQKETDRDGDRGRGKIERDRLPTDPAELGDVSEGRGADDEAGHDQGYDHHGDEANPGGAGRLDGDESRDEPPYVEDVRHHPGDGAENQGDRDLRIKLHAPTRR